jgi:hypothetical protein
MPNQISGSHEASPAMLFGLAIAAFCGAWPRPMNLVFGESVVKTLEKLHFLA